MPVSTPAYSHAVIDVDHQAPDPLSLLVRAYDRAIRACEAFDHADARETISVLRGALELDTAASRSFDALYSWCEESVDHHDFVGAAQCLRSLRDAWRRATQPAAATFSRLRADRPVC
ncbi:MAG: hypothetical protein P3B76_02570 [Gemmatimonadota bacterium]|jgi:hypothetical protein|nr:hypothetical protein [Gemmatimonadota bacterium]MDQ8166834.1 hypothetical protein [Gemmatimonadota bacterium]MDQ8171546.1 hypothetical protein [Gemmatimonadota bacterium]